MSSKGPRSPGTRRVARERHSGLKFNQDFFRGYRPQRINPGDKAHRLTSKADRRQGIAGAPASGR